MNTYKLFSVTEMNKDLNKEAERSLIIRISCSSVMGYVYKHFLGHQFELDTNAFTSRIGFNFNASPKNCRSVMSDSDSENEYDNGMEATSLLFGFSEFGTVTINVPNE